ncbi:hypothetical protein BHE74_00047603 [Ensete ventricosum]|nr:hypothetical protein GW17_00054126 [Ensete ventricosum]RWW46467.1 hypothetical protein BHE74_00047603 [Ensete ventricosum]
MQWDLTGSSLGDLSKRIGKLAGNTSGDRRKKTERLTARMSEAVGLAGGLVFTQRRSIMDAGVPQEELGRDVGQLLPNHYKL